MDTSSAGSFQTALKQWAHFPDELDESLNKAKMEGKFAVNGKAIKVLPEDTKATFLRRIIEESELHSKDIRKLIKICYSLKDPTTQTAVNNLSIQRFFPNQANPMPAKAKDFCKIFFENNSQFDERNYVQFLGEFLKGNGIESPESKNEFAKALALDAPALLYFALPHLEIHESEKLLIVKLATATPISNGLDPKFQKQILCSISVENLIERFRVQTEGQDNIFGVLGYLTEQLGKIPEFQPIDLEKFPRHVLRFLHYANGVFKHGIVCRERAKALGILQVSSLDKLLRHPNEVEVNCIQNSRGVDVAIYHQAKGAITVATERKEDPLTAKIINKKIPGMSMSYATLEDQDALTVLSERAHHCLLIISDNKKLQFNDNQGQVVKSEAEVVMGFQNNCKIRSNDGCLEVKVNSNLNPTTFRAIVMSNRFLPYKNLLSFPPGVEPIFVETIQPQPPTKTYYGFRDANDDNAKTCLVNIPIPNFQAALKKIFETDTALVITHITKGKCRYDPD